LQQDEKGVTQLAKTTILNDPAGIRKVDKSNMLSFCLDTYKHYGKTARLAEAVSISYRKPGAIIVAGMGGSAIGGELLKDWARDRVAIPIEVCRDYFLPEYANRSTLVFVVSYSGETEETLSVLLDAVKRKCMIACISSGGKLVEFAKRLGFPCLCVPSGMAPRASLPYLFVPLIIFLKKLGLASNVDSEISEAVKILKQVSDENSPEKPLKTNFSKTLASNILGTIPVVYGFGVYRAVAQRFKTQCNENSKIPAKWEYFPELNHNDIVGWETAKEFAKYFSIVFLRDESEAKAIGQRIKATKELIREESLRLFEVWSSGHSALAKMSSLISVGDFTSVYLAVLRGVDPTPVKTISLLKEKLKQSGLKEKVVHELEEFALHV
jgi:glucose/mannose-6-phosphate isomerase